MTELHSPSLLIIIVTWNKKDYVLDLLKSVQTLTYPTNSIDIVVVDNASTDGTADAIRANFSTVNLICNPENIGGTGGFNTGLQWAFAQPDGKYKYLWLLDNDVLVHQAALTELVSILEQHPDIAVAGSTMMQLDYPWRINEMGAFLNFGTGSLFLNRHLEEITAWCGTPVYDLLKQKVDLSQQLMHCQPMMDVDYVAAASLLIRVDVAKKVGIWRDYFIHFDDVEWCLRIAKAGHRVVVSAKSLIWHLSAAAKVPTWVLYYDNRNILDLLKTHKMPPSVLRSVEKYILKKAVYYALVGKTDLAQLHHDAVDDFHQNQFGKKNISLTTYYKNPQKITEVLQDTQVKSILLAWTVNLQAANIQALFVQARLQRPDLHIDYLAAATEDIYQLPNTGRIVLPKSRLKRWLTLWRLRNRYDVVMQSDYRMLPLLSWLGREVVFINDEGFCRLTRPRLADVWKMGWRWLWR